jgi:DNA modification methylase
VTVRIYTGDARTVLAPLPERSVQMCVTSPPYFGLRDYNVEGQIGLEPTVDEYVSALVDVFREVRRVLKDDGTCWVNLGDTYASAWPCNRRNVVGEGSLPNGKREARPPRMPEGLKEKDLIGIPWRVAFALQADGWYLRQDIIWHKPNPMPESVKDRCTKSHEYLFLLSKSPRYYYDAEAIAEPATWEPSTSKMPDGWDTGEGAHGSFHRNGREKGGPSSQKGSTFDRDKTAEHQMGRAQKGPRFGGHKYGDSDDPAHATKSGNVYEGSEKRNKRSVWTIATQKFSEAHFATFPTKLIEPCILAGSREGDTVLDPFGGSGTTGLVSDRLNRDAILIDLNPEYIDMARKRITKDAPMLVDVEVIV